MIYNEYKKIKSRPFLCLELLNTFSSKEIQSLLDFISCKYFNTDNYVVLLLKTLEKYVLKKKTFDASVQCNIYEKVFAHLPKPQGRLNQSQGSLLNQKMNTLMRLAERFLSIEALEENEACKNELLYPALLKRKQFLAFNRRINQEKKIIKNEAIKDSAYYARCYQMELGVLDYLNYIGRLREEDNLPAIVHNLDVHYLINKLNLHLTAWSLKRISGKKEYDFSAMEAAEQLLCLPQYANQPMIVLYLANIELMKRQSVATYQNLLNLLEKHAVAIHPSKLKDFYATIIGYCIAKINEGALEYERNMFEIFQTMHEKNLLLEDGFIVVGELKNIVVASCRVAEFEWAKQIIEDYKTYIEASIRESVYHFNYGVIAFHQKKYEFAHNRFIQVGKVNMIYEINVKVLILKCLYENEKEYSEPIVQAFRTAERYFINHKSLTGQRKKAYKNFIQILINLYRIRHRATKMTIERLIEKLEAQQVNSDKRWLLEKMEELESDKNKKAFS